VFEPIDYSVARRVGAKNKEETVAVAYLSLVTRLGHFCLFCNETSVIPDPLLILGEDLAHTIFKGFSSLKETNGIVHENGYWYFVRRYNEEKTIVHHYKRLLAAEPVIDVNLTALVQQDADLLAEQKEAILQAAKYPVTLLTGGPGTGKSFTAGKLIHYLRLFYPDMRIALAAPTGKAAANLQKNLAKGMPEAQTIHRLLDYRLRQDNPTLLRYDLILIDESSMVDGALFAKLLSSIASGTRLILLGDPHQLPPVEGGAVFHDLIDWHQKQSFALTHLTQCRRTHLTHILDLASAVNRGDAKHVLEAMKTQDNLIEKLKIPYIDADIAQDELLAIFEKRVILSPLRKGPFGTEALNRACRSRYGSGYVPIMITRNDEDLALANGETGVLVKKGSEIARGDYALFRSGEGIRKIPALLLPPFEDAYCLSVHKSQGSEYSEVTVVVPEGSERFGRELLYTAITRAKDKVELVGDARSVERTVNNRFRRLSRIHRMTR